MIAVFSVFGPRFMFSFFLYVLFFFFNDTATTEIYTLSLHDPLPISPSQTQIWKRVIQSDACLRSPWTPSESGSSQVVLPARLCTRRIFHLRHPDRECAVADVLTGHQTFDLE